MTAIAPQPPFDPIAFREKSPAQFELLVKLSQSAAAQALLDPKAKGPALQAAVAAFIAQGQAAGLPPELWTLHRAMGWSQSFSPPFIAFQSLSQNGAGRAQAAQALADAGCSLWHSGWQIYADGDQARLFDFHPHNVASFAVADTDTPLRRLYLKLALTDPLTPKDFAETLIERYEEAVAGSSKTAKGVLGRGDKTAKAVCSVLSSCEAELLAAASRPGEGWARLPGVLADAKERLEAKNAAADVLTPEEIRKTVTPEQRRRIRSLSALLSKSPDDEELILMAFEASPWLKAQPALACLSFSSGVSLFAQAIGFGCSSALDWMEKTGSNIWLASAQAGESNACLWALSRLDAFSPKDDLSPIARALLRGAWLDGTPDPKARCLDLAKAALEELGDHRSADDEESQKANALVAAIERLTLEEVVGPVASAVSAAKAPRRSAL